MHFQQTLWAILVMIASTLFASLAQAIPVGLIPCLYNIKSRSVSSLITPASDLYDVNRLGFNHYFNYKPSAIFYPASEAEAAAAILCAVANNVSVVPRSGGHSYEGYSQGGQDGSLVIDLSQFQQFSLNPQTDVATVGAGTRLGHMYIRLWEAGEYLVPAGNCPSVGVGGHSLGGGFGVVSRKYGMLTHNIVGLSMVAANGTIFRVNAATNPDLFWALRGAGGGSFGLVTEFHIQAYKAPAIITTAVITFQPSLARVAMKAFATWGRTATEDLVAIMYIDQKTIRIEITVLGTQALMKTAIEPLLHVMSVPSDMKIQEGTWLQAARQWGDSGGTTLESSSLKHRALYHRGRSLLYRQPLSEEEMDIVEKYLNNPPKESISAYLIFDLWGGKIDRPNIPSAFDNHKGVLFSIQSDIFWNAPDKSPGYSSQECQQWSAEFAKEMQKAYSSGSSIEAYQNYIERDLPNAFSAYYGDNFLRLQQIKKDVDPYNVFKFPQSIPLP
ncbi:hypothetical protein BGW42_006407 [Actinomortierella wolfii]|nr:hypothetical protein BGW42_006407 [Actinomortierella wolfii]